MSSDIIYRCNCGAYTVEIGSNSISMPKDEFQKNFPFQIALFTTHNCNYCVNHWGTDLCQCGSGEHPENCCNQEPYQNLLDVKNNSERISKEDTMLIGASQ